jgi:hypothetical protein
LYFGENSIVKDPCATAEKCYVCTLHEELYEGLPSSKKASGPVEVIPISSKHAIFNIGNHFVLLQMLSSDVKHF